jgi:hypothetical protein
MSRPRARWLVCAGLVCAGLVGLTGCVQHVRAPAGVPARAIAERIGAAAQPADGGGLVLAIERAGAGGKPRLIAYDLAGQRERFRVDVAEAADASAHGDVVLVQAGASLSALDAASGRELYRVALPSGRYAGAARAGDRIALVTVSGRALDPDARSQLTVVAARSGAATGALELPGDAGRPIATGGYVLVPSQRQRISVVDLERGEEVARLRAQSDAIEWLDVQRGADGAPALLFGGRNFHRLARADAQPSSSGRLPEQLSALPGRPSAPHSAYESLAGRRIGLHVTPVPAGPSEVSLLRDRAYFVFYSLLFAFDGQGSLRFVRSLASDVIAARVLNEGLLVALASGELALLSHESGGALATRAIVAPGGAGLRSAELPARALPIDRADGALPPGALTLALIEAASAHDGRLVPARVYAVEQLAKLPDEIITGALLELYERPNTPSELQSAIATALSERRTGLPALVAALERRYDFIEGTRPAPLAIIAPALARAGERSAAPGLLARVWDHETPATALPSLLRALGLLGDAATAASLLDWLAQYRADSSLRAEPEALLEGARAAFALDREGSREALALLASTPQLTEASALAIRALIEPPAKPAEPAQLAKAEPPAPPKPRLPSQSALDAAFAAHLEAIQPCVALELQRDPKLRQLRIAFIAEGDGSAHAFHFAPASDALANCMYPKVASIRLPVFTEPRSVEHVVINLKHEAEQATAPAAGSDDVPWWAQQARASRERTNATPWWRIEQLLPPRLDASAGSALEIEAGARPSAELTPPPSPTAPVTPVPVAPPQPAAAAPAAPAGPTPAAPTPAASTEEPEQPWWVPKAE